MIAERGCVQCGCSQGRMFRCQSCGALHHQHCTADHLGNCTDFSNHDERGFASDLLVRVDRERLITTRISMEQPVCLYGPREERHAE